MEELGGRGERERGGGGGGGEGGGLRGLSPTVPVLS